MEQKENLECVYLSIQKVAQRYSISKSTIYRWVGEGNFPEHKVLGENCSRWHIEDLIAWERQAVENN